MDTSGAGDAKRRVSRARRACERDTRVLRATVVPPGLALRWVTLFDIPIARSDVSQVVTGYRHRSVLPAGPPRAVTESRRPADDVWPQAPGAELCVSGSVCQAFGATDSGLHAPGAGRGARRGHSRQRRGVAQCERSPFGVWAAGSSQAGRWTGIDCRLPTRRWAPSVWRGRGDSASRLAARRGPPHACDYAALPAVTGSAVVISSLRVFSATFTIGIVISSTPSCIAALASSGFTPSGSGRLR